MGSAPLICLPPANASIVLKAETRSKDPRCQLSGRPARAGRAVIAHPQRPSAQPRLHPGHPRRDRGRHDRDPRMAPRLGRGEGETWKRLRLRLGARQARPDVAWTPTRTRRTATAKSIPSVERNRAAVRVTADVAGARFIMLLHCRGCSKRRERRLSAEDPAPKVGLTGLRRLPSKSPISE